MPVLPQPLPDPSWLKFVPLGALFIALGSLLISFLSWVRSGRALRLAETQERRKLPGFSMYLDSSFLRRAKDKQAWFFLVSFSTQSDNPTAVQSLVLRVKYRTGEGIPMTVDLQCKRTSTALEEPPAPLLHSPFQVPAHGSVAGWITFDVDRALFANCAIDKYILIAVDVHGLLEQTELYIIPESHEIS